MTGPFHTTPRDEGGPLSTAHGVVLNVLQCPTASLVSPDGRRSGGST